jgi:colanic acid/amylovoran biosynthesis protein
MLRSVLEVLPGRVGPCSFAVLTTYPEADRVRPVGPGVRIVALRPVALVVPVLPLAILIALARRFGGSGRGFARLHPALRALHEADVVVDLAGVSFVDGRSFPILVYNVLMTGVAVLTGTPVVKCSQALGPFRGRVNRLAARLVLPHLAAVIARGDRTREHLDDLGLDNAEEAADLAFCLPVTAADRSEAEAALARAGVAGAYVTVVPSAVVQEYCETIGVDYPGLLASTCRQLADEGHRVVVLAHSIRPGAPASRMNDLPLVEDLGRRLAATDAVAVVDDDLEPAVLRAIIGSSDACITSRFHAMVSSLSEGVPVLVVGWSHKYGEVLRDFGLDDWAMAYDELEPDLLVARCLSLLAERASLRRQVVDRLPAVIERSHHNFEIVARSIASGGSA